MIPDAAVEAAADATHNYLTREAIQAALEAAAPHMLAGAWDEGYRECYERQMYEPVPTNPHRQAP